MFTFRLLSQSKREDTAWSLLFYIVILRGKDQKKYGPQKYGVDATLYFLKFQALKKYQVDLID